MNHKWKLSKKEVDGRIYFGFEIRTGEESKVVTPVWQVEDGDELTALIELCTYTARIEYPLEVGSSLSLENVKGMARRGGAEVDQTASSASPSPPCSDSSFVDLPQSGDKMPSLVPCDPDNSGLLGTQADLYGGGSSTDDGNGGDVLSVDPSLCRCVGGACGLVFGVCDADKIREYHRIDELIELFDKSDCGELRIHHSDVFGGDMRSLCAFLEVIGHDMRVGLGHEIRMRGSWIFISSPNVKSGGAPL